MTTSKPESATLCCSTMPADRLVQLQPEGPPAHPKTLEIELLAIDLSSCQRCIPTADQIRRAVEILRPAAEALGIDLRYKETVVKSEQEARQKALRASPTIRINGRDIAAELRESVCESCSDLTQDNYPVECREWLYRGEVYPYAPLPMLVEAIMEAMLRIDQLSPVSPSPLAELPENLRNYFRRARRGSGCCG